MGRKRTPRCSLQPVPTGRSKHREECPAYRTMRAPEWRVWACLPLNAFSFSLYFLGPDLPIGAFPFVPSSPLAPSRLAVLKLLERLDRTNFSSETTRFAFLRRSFWSLEKFLSLSQIRYSLSQAGSSIFAGFSDVPERKDLIECFLVVSGSSAHFISVRIIGFKIFCPFG